MADKLDITPELLRQLLRYEPETGKLFWLQRNSDNFKSADSCKRWNARFADKEAFTAHSNSGYRVTTIRRYHLKAHRVAWAIYYGEWPDGQIDHINHRRADNRIANLRVVSHQENARNRSGYRNNKSGFTGVSWSANKLCWHAQICTSGKVIHLGHFEKLDDAVAVRKAAESEFVFHPNHGGVVSTA